MASREELAALATQLSHPSGEKGIEIADMMNETNIRMTRHAVASLALGEDQKLLEMGHGNAGHVKEVLGPYKDITYYGLEVSDLMNEEAKRLNQSLISEQRAYFSVYDGMAIPFLDNYFDKAFTVNTIYFWKEPAGLLEELYRVLKRGGQLAITFAQASFMKQLPFTQYGFELYSTERVVNLVKSTSFTIISTDTQSEEVKSKTGELVTREFTTVVVEKKM